MIPGGKTIMRLYDRADDNVISALEIRSFFTAFRCYVGYAPGSPGEVTAVINIIFLIMCIASTIVRHDIDITYRHDKIKIRK